MAAADKTVTQAGFQLIISSGSLSRKVREAVLLGLKEVAEEYKKRVIANISLDDHTLKELRKLGHPYAVGKPEGTLHGDDRLVHVQEGKLKRSIRANPVEETTSRRFSVFVSSADPKLPYLIYGTTVMRPRRFHEKAYQEIKERFWKPVLEKLAKVEHRMAATAREAGR